MRQRVKIALGILLTLTILSAGGRYWISFHRNFYGTVQPYVQPGTNSVVNGGLDTSRLVWITQASRQEFTVEYGPSPEYGRTAVPMRVELKGGGNALKYVATLTDLELDSRVYYRVRLGHETISTNSFAARKSPTNTIHFVAVGDTVHKRPPERRIAWEISQQRPDFLMHLGDIVYFKGKVSEYRDRFWPCYNDSSRSSADVGAPIMGSVPFYIVLGNHDVIYGLDLDKLPDAVDNHDFHNRRDCRPGVNAAVGIISVAR